MTTMLYQGHGSYRLTLDDGTVVYVDPSLGEGYDVPADLVLVTHEHPDHNVVDKMSHAPGCQVLRAADFLDGGRQLSLQAKGVKMTAVQAYNAYHPVDECVGIVLEFDGIRFYAAGDTSATQDMESGRLAALELDYATFPADGYYNMDVAEASRCAQLVAAKHSIPLHLVPVHDVSCAVLFDEEKAAAFDAPGKLVLHPGESITL